MMLIDRQACTGCGTCGRDCPLGIILIKDKKAAIQDGCVQCRTCLKVCPAGAVSERVETPAPGVLVCGSCPVACQVPPGLSGACRRYRNQGGRLERGLRPLTYAQVSPELGPPADPLLDRPLITAIGAGGTYPDYVPAPYIVTSNRDGVAVVTTVTEAPLSYSGVKVKVDTDLHLGKEGDVVTFEGRAVGMVETEEYGSKILALGGVNRLTGKHGFAAARAVAAIANRQAVKLKIRGGASLLVQVGQPPVIDGQTAGRMRVGCGSATAGLFAPFLQKAADEVIVLDAHITSLFSHHAAGRYLGRTPLGLELNFNRSTPGRYFGRPGAGWGGTDISDPLQIIAKIDTARTPVGTTLFITETTGERAALFELGQDGQFHPIPLTPAASEALAAIAETCQQSRVSALYVGGAGGSARAGVARYPLRLTKAVHAGRARLSVGGAPVFVLPGGGITFYVDVEQVRAGSFTWVPTPATVCPIEYTMRLSDFKAMGGHVEAMRPFKADEPQTWSP